MAMPSQSVLTKLVSYYYVEDNKLYRKTTSRNKKQVAGAEAGWLDKLGYRVMEVSGCRFPVHRALYFLYTGQWCEYLDHINGDVRDNSLANLRPATHSQNMRNTRLSKRNTSGHKGVSWDRRRCLWMVRIRHEEVYKFGGYFTSLQEAAAAASTLRSRFHKEFANTGV